MQGLCTVGYICLPSIQVTLSDIIPRIDSGRGPASSDSAVGAGGAVCSSLEEPITKTGPAGLSFIGRLIRDGPLSETGHEMWTGQGWATAAPRGVRICPEKSLCEGRWARRPLGPSIPLGRAPGAQGQTPGHFTSVRPQVHLLHKAAPLHSLLLTLG